MLDDCTSNDKVLFIDEDSETLRSILKELSASNYDLYIAETVVEARKVMITDRMDVVVCNVKVGGASGIDFLASLKKRYPNIHRVILNEGENEDTVAAAVIRGQATTTIPKPWPEGGLKSNIDHILKMRSALKQKMLLEELNEIDRLPSLPTLYQEFTEAVANEKPVKEISTIIESDVSLSTRLLQIGNSAFFGSTSNIYSVDQAVVRLGLNTVKDMVMTFAFVNELDWSDEQLNRLQAIFKHSSLVNRFLKVIFQKKHKQPLSQAMACIGITHDIGKVIILQYFTDRYEAILENQQKLQGATFYESEKALGFKWFEHQDVGAYFLHMWNLPDAVVEATLYHHEPQKAGEQNRHVIEALAFTNDLVARLELLGEDEEIPWDRLNRDYLSQGDLEQIARELRVAMRTQVAPGL
ncbi:MAG: response regulator [Planctomycetota bacterium]